jgi:diguanylate cyclase (GGDEF)-like protein/PAS domain S-box-containing protein
MRLLLHEIIYIIIFFFAAALFLLAWPRRKTPGGGFFICHLLGLAIWAIGLFFEAIGNIVSTRILWSQISYFGVVTVAPLLFMFVLAYTTQQKLSKRTVISLMVIPFLVLVAAWTNQWHHLLWPNFYWGSREYNILVYEHGFVFYFNVIYIYFLIAFGVAALIRAIPRNQPPFRSQLVIILIAVSFPMISGSMYIFKIAPVPGMDISIFGFLMTSLILAFGFVRYQLLDLVPVAKEVVIQNLQDGMIVVDWMRRIVEVNQNAIDLMVLPQKGLLGKNVDAILPCHFDLPALSKANIPVECMLEEPEKRYLDLRVSSLAKRTSTPPGYLLVIRDITIQKEAELKLKEANDDLKVQLNKVNRLQELLKDQASHDALTGLHNRHTMDEVLDEQLNQAKVQHYPFSIAILDIDHFKRVNDIYGHQMGDAILQEFSKSILGSIRKSDFACRFGGDEVLLAFEQMGLEAVTSKALEIHQNLKLIEVEQNLVKVSATACIGVATYPLHGNTVKELISAADQALYEAKAAGRDKVVQAKATPYSGQLNGME